MIHAGVCHGTLGELLQGPVLHDGELHIGLVSLPLKRYSRMRFTSAEDGRAAEDLAAAGLADKPKCRRAMDLYARHHGITLPAGRWSCTSDLATGKGMASSTADIVATLRCLDSIGGRRTPVAAITAILREIERSDSVFLGHYALYLSGRQQVVQAFDAKPRFEVCYLDEGGAVDTEAMGPALLRHYQAQARAHAHNLDRAITAFGASDARAIARCATASAGLSQAVNPRRSFDALLREQQPFGADGIVVAHTGTLLGYLFAGPPDPMRLGEVSAFFAGLGHECQFAQAGF